MQLISLPFLLSIPALASAVNITALLTSTPQLSTLTSLVTQFPDLVATLSEAKDITILAPNNAAFAKALSGFSGNQLKNNKALQKALLTYHVIPANVPAAAVPAAGTFAPTLLADAKYTTVTGGQRVKAIAANGGVTFVSGGATQSKVVTADVAFDGGLVHIIDTVLSIPAAIPQTAIGAGLTTLAIDLIETGLLTTVSGLKDVTVFAPTNAAFSKIASVTEDLELDQLAAILKLHVVAGTVAYSTTLKTGSQVATVNGASVGINVGNGTVTVNNAKVVTADVLVSNGVVHVIDTVLTPAAN